MCGTSNTHTYMSIIYHYQLQTIENVLYLYVIYLYVKETKTTPI